MIDPITGLPVSAGPSVIVQDRVFWDTVEVVAGIGDQDLVFFKETKDSYLGNIPSPSSFGATIAFQAKAFMMSLVTKDRTPLNFVNAGMISDILMGGVVNIGQDVAVDLFQMPLSLLMVPTPVTDNAVSGSILQNTMGLKIFNEALTFSGGSVKTKVKLNLKADASNISVQFGFLGFFAANPRQ